MMPIVTLKRKFDQAGIPFPISETTSVTGFYILPILLEILYAYISTNICILYLIFTHNEMIASLPCSIFLVYDLLKYMLEIFPY